jgi:hypothetical protein
MKNEPSEIGTVNGAQPVPYEAPAIEERTPVVGVLCSGSLSGGGGGGWSLPGF